MLQGLLALCFLRCRLPKLNFDFALRSNLIVTLDFPDFN
jgi:hypothetical protein